MSAGATAAAAAAAAEAARREEEEEMTQYGDDDLQGHWEFKIVRANTAAFTKPDILRQVCAEEARAGWILLEKFDDMRLRFKRPLSARSGDADLVNIGIDPYRTRYGMSQGAIVAAVFASLFGVAALFAFVLILVKR
jgi:hypothetical protein